MCKLILKFHRLLNKKLLNKKLLSKKLLNKKLLKKNYLIKNYLIKNYLIKNYLINNYLIKNYLIKKLWFLFTFFSSFLKSHYPRKISITALSAPRTRPLASPQTLWPGSHRRKIALFADAAVISKLLAAAPSIRPLNQLVGRDAPLAKKLFSGTPLSFFTPMNTQR